MENYIGTKEIKAEGGWSKGDAEKHLGRSVGGEHESDAEGYLVTYEGGYQAWSPKDVFDVAYRKTSGLPLGLAIEALKLGYRGFKANKVNKVARQGWNGKDMYLYLVDPYLNDQFEITEKPEMVGTLAPFIMMKTADNQLVPWLASQTDVLAEDWVLI